MPRQTAPKRPARERQGGNSRFRRRLFVVTHATDLIRHLGDDANLLHWRRVSTGSWPIIGDRLVRALLGDLQHLLAQSLAVLIFNFPKSRSGKNLSRGNR